MFSRLVLRNTSVIKGQMRVYSFFIFRLKMISWDCLLESGLRLIFHSKSQRQIFFKSLVSSFAEIFISSVTNRSDLEHKSFDKQFISSRSSSNSRMNHWGTPVCTFSQEDVSLLGIYLYFLLLKFLDKISSR